MRDRITQIKIRAMIQLHLWRNIRKWGRWQRGGMLESEAREWKELLRRIEKRYGYHATVPFYEDAKGG